MKDYSDRRLKNVCPQCGTAVGKGNRSSDHVPSKCLLRESEGSAEDQFPSNLPVAFTCRDCNQRFSSDEQYFCVFLNCVLVGSTEPDDHDEPRVRNALERNSGLRARIEASKHSGTLNGEVCVTWIPELARVNRVIVKNASRARLLRVRRAGPGETGPCVGDASTSDDGGWTSGFRSWPIGIGRMAGSGKSHDAKTGDRTGPARRMGSRPALSLSVPRRAGRRASRQGHTARLPRDGSSLGLTKNASLLRTRGQVDPAGNAHPPRDRPDPGRVCGQGRLPAFRRAGQGDGGGWAGG